MNKSTKLFYLQNLQVRPWQKGPSLWICDQKVLKAMPGLVQWISTHSGFLYAVKAGEPLKSVEAFPNHLKKISRMLRQVGPRNIHIVALGGGTVGDFSGFVASTLWRGVPLVHIPTSWLAALDSAHGGKNGLNLAGHKNQIGTIYMPKEVLLVRELLGLQPKILAKQAMGELVKMGLVTGGSLWQKLKHYKSSESSERLLWDHLKLAVDAKYNVVARDPEEKLGIRHQLNFGHTLGHVWEACWQWPHGDAVMQGIYFALTWSRYLQILSASEESQIRHVLQEQLQLPDLSQSSRQKEFRLSRARFEAGLLADKKRKGANKIRFILIKKPGQLVIRQVPLPEILKEAVRQGWLR